MSSVVKPARGLVVDSMARERERADARLEVGALAETRVLTTETGRGNGGKQNNRTLGIDGGIDHFRKIDTQCLFGQVDNWPKNTP